METNPTTPTATSSYLNADNVNTSLPSTTIYPQTNYYNAPTNLKMTLADARTELKSHGFIILEQQQQHELLSSSSRSLLVGRRSECRWCSLMKMDTLIFVQELVLSDDPLTVGRIQDDLQKLKTDWLASLMPTSIYSPNGCPPHGVCRNRLILMMYLTQQPISSDVALYLTQKPPGEWCQVTLLAAQDGSNGASYYYSQDLSYWGRSLYPEVRYWAGLLTGRRPLPEKPKPYALHRSRVCILGNIFGVMYFLYIFPLNTISGQKFWLIVIGFMFVSLLCSFAYHECRRRQERRNACNSMTNNNDDNNNTMDFESRTSIGATMDDCIFYLEDKICSSVTRNK